MMGVMGMHLKVPEWTINHSTRVQKSIISEHEDNTALQKLEDEAVPQQLMWRCIIL